jgi:S-adenosylhomocysteine hydrolase
MSFANQALGLEWLHSHLDELEPIVYGIPALPIASVLLAFLPATGRWAR